MEGDIIMKESALKIARTYRKSFSYFASKYPKEAFDYWMIYTNKLDGVIELLAYSDEISCKDFKLIVKYIRNKMDELYYIYCK